MSFGSLFRILSYFYLPLAINRKKQENKQASNQTSRKQQTPPGKSMPRHYRSITTALPQHYHSNTTALPQHYRSITTTLPQHYHSITTALPQHYHNIATTLPQHYHSITTALPQHCHDIATALPQYCHSITTALTQHHSITSALPQHSSKYAFRSPARSGLLAPGSPWGSFFRIFFIIFPSPLRGELFSAFVVNF